MYTPAAIYGNRTPSATAEVPLNGQLINAAIQSFFDNEAPASTGAASVYSNRYSPRSQRGSNGGARRRTVNVVQDYYTSFLNSTSSTGQRIPRSIFRGTLEVDESCLNREYDYDFTNTDDRGKTFQRGNEPYQRPCGSYRIGLNIEDKYADDNAWFGMTGTDTNEWPVSYHGTTLRDASRIAQDGFELARSNHYTAGRGIYSTPDVALAKSYGNPFEHDGKSFICIMQNRVNPKYRKVLPQSQTSKGIHWLSVVENGVSESDVIRPYGVCVFRA